jgi:hypothetical protein
MARIAQINETAYAVNAESHKCRVSKLVAIIKTSRVFILQVANSGLFLPLTLTNRENIMKT